MTKPAWEIEIEEWLKTHNDFLGGLDSGMIEPLEEKIGSVLSSELQAVLGEEKKEEDIKKENFTDEELEQVLLFNSAYNSHREACLKRMRERGIIK